METPIGEEEDSHSSTSSRTSRWVAVESIIGLPCASRTNKVLKTLDTARRKCCARFGLSDGCEHTWKSSDRTSGQRERIRRRSQALRKRAIVALQEPPELPES